MNLENLEPKSKGVVFRGGEVVLRGECQKDQRNSSKGLQVIKSRAIRPSKQLSTVVDYSSPNNSGIYESILLTSGTKIEGF